MNGAERPDPVALRTFVQDRREAMLELLARLTRAESPSDVPESQAEVRSIIASGDFDEYWHFHEKAEGERNHL